MKRGFTLIELLVVIAIMFTLGLNEGKVVGIIKKRMENAIIDGHIPYDRSAALEFVKQLYKEQSNEIGTSGEQ